MKLARSVFAAPFAFAAALAACSGNLGGGSSTLPSGQSSPLQQIVQPSPTASPLSASNIATLGESTAPQPLPTIAGYGGTVAFPKPAAAPTGKASPGPVAVGITAAIVEPTDAPKFEQTANAKRKLLGSKSDPYRPKPLLFITLLATGDLTLEEYPRFAIDVPRDVVTKYREGSFGLALFDPAEKTKRYRLAVAERDVATPPPTATPSASPAPKPSPTPAPKPTPSSSGAPGSFTPPPLPSASPTATLPPQRIAFTGPAAQLKLVANRPVVFALYAVPPQPTPSPSPSSSPAPAASASATPSPPPPATPSVVPSRTPAASGT